MFRNKKLYAKDQTLLNKQGKLIFAIIKLANKLGCS